MKKKKKKFRLEQELNPGRNALSSELLEPIGDQGPVSRKSRGPFLEAPGNYRAR